MSNPLTTLVNTTPTAADLAAAAATLADSQGNVFDVMGTYTGAIFDLNIAVQKLYQIMLLLPTGATKSAIEAVTVPLIGS